MSKYRAFTGGCLAILVAAALTATGAMTAHAAAPAVEKSIEELEELDEVIVHGTRLQDRIAKAEDRFYKLYNQLNKKDDFDVNCPYLPLDGDTRIEGRMCMPSFYANALADMVVWNQRCRGETDEEGNYVPPPPCYTPPSAEVVLMSRAGEFARNVMDVIKTDSRLLEMATELDALHLERARLQRRYLQIRAEVGEKRAAEPRYQPKIR